MGKSLSLQHHFVHWVVRISLDHLDKFDGGSQKVVSNCNGCLAPILATCLIKLSTKAAPAWRQRSADELIGDLPLPPSLLRILQLATLGFRAYSGREIARMQNVGASHPVLGRWLAPTAWLVEVALTLDSAVGISNVVER